MSLCSQDFPLCEKLSKLDQLSFGAKKSWAKVQYYIYVRTSMNIVQVRPTPWLHNRYSGIRVHSKLIRYMMHVYHLHANKFGAFDPVYHGEKLATVYLKSITVLDNQLTRSAGCLITDSLASPSSDIISCSNMIAPCSLITIRYGSHRVA